MGGKDDRTVEIELWDEADDGRSRGHEDAGKRTEGSAGPQPRPPRETSRSARRSLRTTLTRVLAVVAVLGIAAVANVREQQEEARRTEVFASMPGLVERIDGPLELTWEHPDWVWVRSGVVTAAGSRSVVLLHPGTGLPLDIPLEPEQQVEPCGELPDAVPPMIVCWRWDLLEQTEVGAVRYGELVGLDADDGRTLFIRDAQVPSSFAAGDGFGAVGGDIVTADVEGTQVTVTRADAVSGRERWSTPLGPGLDEGEAGVVVKVRGPYVLVQAASSVVLDLEDGRELARWASSGPGLVAPGVIGEDGYGTWTEVTESLARSERGTWFSADGTQVPVDGVVQEPQVTDGSAKDVLIVVRDYGMDLVGVQRATGEDLWSADLRGGEVLMRRDGAAVAADGRRLAAFDLRTGAERWSRPLEGLDTDAGSVTDGRTVVVAAHRDGGWALDAVSLDTGRVAWTTEVPPGEPGDPGRGIGVHLMEVGGHVVVVHDASVIGMA